MLTFPPIQGQGLFIGTTDLYDSDTIYSLQVTAPEFKEYLVFLRQYINDMATILNKKDSAVYDVNEFVNGQVWFRPPTSALQSISTNQFFRQDYRTVVNFGALPNNGSKSVAHNINITGAQAANFTFTRIYATASDTTGFSYIPIPYASNVAAKVVELSVNSTQVTITTSSNLSNYNVCYVVLEYLKN